MNTDKALEALKDANIQLRNMEVASEGHKLSTQYARTYADYLAYMISTATKMHTKCVEALVSDAMSTLHSVGYEVVAPKPQQAPSDLNTAIALLVRNGYKVTDPNGGNC